MNNSTDELWELHKANDEIAYDLIPAMVYVAVLMLLGIVGNLLVCFVFVFRLRMTTQDCLISALAVFDLLSCFIAMPTEIVDMRYFLMFDDEFACRLLRFIIHFCAFGSILTLVVIALDRYVKVCHPLQRQMSLKNVKLAILFVLLVTVVFAFPATILYGTRTTEVANLTIAGHDCSINDQVRGTVYPLVYNSVLFVAFFLLFVMLTVIYIRIWREMKRHRIYMARNSIGGSGGDSRFYPSSTSEASGFQFRAGSSRAGSGSASASPVDKGRWWEECGCCRRKEGAAAACSQGRVGLHLPSVRIDASPCRAEDAAEGGVDQGGTAAAPPGRPKSCLQNFSGAEKGGLCHHGQQCLANQERPPRTSPVVMSECAPSRSADVDIPPLNGRAVLADRGGAGHTTPTPPASGGAGQDVATSDRRDVVGLGMRKDVAGLELPTATTQHSASSESCPASVTSVASTLSPSPSPSPSPPPSPSPSISQPPPTPSPTSGATTTTTTPAVAKTDSNESLSSDSEDSAELNGVKDSTAVDTSDSETEYVALGNLYCDRGLGVSDAKQADPPQTGQESASLFSALSVPFTRDGEDGKSVSNHCRKLSQEETCVCSLNRSSAVDNTDAPPQPPSPDLTLTDPVSTSRPEDRVKTNGEVTRTAETVRVPPATYQLGDSMSETMTKRALTGWRSMSEVKSRKATVIATSVTVVFFLSFTPHLSLITVRTLNTEFDRHLTGASLVLYNIFLRSYFINSVSNPIIYGVFNSRFRKEVLHVFRQIWSCCRHR